MNLVVTHLDKVLLLQTLYAHATPRREGHLVQEQRRVRGENVAWLTHRECSKLLRGSTRDSPVYHIDFCEGRPLKLAFTNRKDKSILVDPFSYDVLNARYRFLEALLHVFDPEKIIIKERFEDYPSLANWIYQQCRNLLSPKMKVAP